MLGSLLVLTACGACSVAAPLPALIDVWPRRRASGPSTTGMRDNRWAVDHFEDTTELAQGRLRHALLLPGLRRAAGVRPGRHLRHHTQCAAQLPAWAAQRSRPSLDITPPRLPHAAEVQPGQMTRRLPPSCIITQGLPGSAVQEQDCCEGGQSHCWGLCGNIMARPAHQLCDLHSPHRLSRL